MDRQVHNIEPKRIKWVAQTCDCSAVTALAALNLYGFCEYLHKVGAKPSLISYASAMGMSLNTVKAHAKLLKAYGFLGDRYVPAGIPFDEPIVEKPEADSEPKPEPKKVERKKPDAGHELIAVWNKHKPKKWVALQDLSPSRIRSIKKLGGYKAVIELLPKALASARQDKFWATKRMTWENVVGRGAIPKPNLTTLAESYSGSNLDSSDGTGKLPEHPEFFRPTISGLMIAKPGIRFESVEDKQAREDIAREFYSSQS